MLLLLLLLLLLFISGSRESTHDDKQSSLPNNNSIRQNLLAILANGFLAIPIASNIKEANIFEDVYKNDLNIMIKSYNEAEEDPEIHLKFKEIEMSILTAMVGAETSTAIPRIMELYGSSYSKRLALELMKISHTEIYRWNADDFEKLLQIRKDCDNSSHLSFCRYMEALIRFMMDSKNNFSQRAISHNSLVAPNIAQFFRFPQLGHLAAPSIDDILELVPAQYEEEDKKLGQSIGTMAKIWQQWLFIHNPNTRSDVSHMVAQVLRDSAESIYIDRLEEAIGDELKDKTLDGYLDAVVAKVSKVDGRILEIQESLGKLSGQAKETVERQIEAIQNMFVNEQQTTLASVAKSLGVTPPTYKVEAIVKSIQDKIDDAEGTKERLLKQLESQSLSSERTRSELTETIVAGETSNTKLQNKIADCNKLLATAKISLEKANKDITELEELRNKTQKTFELEKNTLNERVRLVTQSRDEFSQIMETALQLVGSEENYSNNKTLLSLNNANPNQRLFIEKLTRLVDRVREVTRKKDENDFRAKIHSLAEEIRKKDALVRELTEERIKVMEKIEEVLRTSSPQNALKSAPRTIDSGLTQLLEKLSNVKTNYGQCKDENERLKIKLQSSIGEREGSETRVTEEESDRPDSLSILDELRELSESGSFIKDDLEADFRHELRTCWNALKSRKFFGTVKSQPSSRPKLNETLMPSINGYGIRRLEVCRWKMADTLVSTIQIGIELENQKLASERLQQEFFSAKNSYQKVMMLVPKMLKSKEDRSPRNVSCPSGIVVLPPKVEIKEPLDKKYSPEVRFSRARAAFVSFPQYTQEHIKAINSLARTRLSLFKRHSPRSTLLELVDKISDEYSQFSDAKEKLERSWLMVQGVIESSKSHPIGSIIPTISHLSILHTVRKVVEYKATTSRGRILMLNPYSSCVRNICGIFTNSQNEGNQSNVPQGLPLRKIVDQHLSKSPSDQIKVAVNLAEHRLSNIIKSERQGAILKLVDEAILNHLELRNSYEETKRSLAAIQSILKTPKAQLSAILQPLTSKRLLLTEIKLKKVEGRTIIPGRRLQLQVFPSVLYRVHKTQFQWPQKLSIPLVRKYTKPYIETRPLGLTQITDKLMLKEIAVLFDQSAMTDDLRPSVMNHLKNCEASRKELAHMKRREEWLLKRAVSPIRRFSKIHLLQPTDPTVMTTVMVKDALISIFGRPQDDNLVLLLEDLAREKGKICDTGENLLDGIEKLQLGYHSTEDQNKLLIEMSAAMRRLGQILQFEREKADYNLRLQGVWSKNFITPIVMERKFQITRTVYPLNLARLTGSISGLHVSAPHIISVKDEAKDEWPHTKEADINGEATSVLLDKMKLASDKFLMELQEETYRLKKELLQSQGSISSLTKSNVCCLTKLMRQQLRFVEQHKRLLLFSSRQLEGERTDRTRPSIYCKPKECKISTTTHERIHKTVQSKKPKTTPMITSPGKHPNTDIPSYSETGSPIETCKILTYNIVAQLRKIPSHTCNCHSTILIIVPVSSSSISRDIPVPRLVDKRFIPSLPTNAPKGPILTSLASTGLLENHCKEQLDLWMQLKDDNSSIIIDDDCIKFIPLSEFRMASGIKLSRIQAKNWNSDSIEAIPPRNIIYVRFDFWNPRSQACLAVSEGQIHKLRENPVVYHHFLSVCNI